MSTPNLLPSRVAELQVQVATAVVSMPEGAVQRLLLTDATKFQQALKRLLPKKLWQQALRVTRDVCMHPEEMIPDEDRRLIAFLVERTLEAVAACRGGRT